MFAKKAKISPYIPEFDSGSVSQTFRKAVSVAFVGNTYFCFHSSVT